jgi:8-oxo-dGTP pyrophosphatase MutT (NUDIX family)
MEEWDIYDSKRNHTGRIGIRGKNLAEGEYHLVVFVIIRNSEGKYIISKRSKEKTFSNTWEVTGGSAICGDSSIEAAKREVKEELGIDLCGEGCLLKTLKIDSECSSITDIWYFEQDVIMKDIVCQVEEVADAKIVDIQEVDKLFEQGVFMPGFPHVYHTMKEKHLEQC